MKSLAIILILTASVSAITLVSQSFNRGGLLRAAQLKAPQPIVVTLQKRGKNGVIKYF